MRTVNGSIRVFDDPGSLARAFAGELVSLIAGGPACGIALSGGSTPRLLFEELARRSASVDWKGVHFYWGDERCVPPDDKDSNYRMAREALFDRIHIPAANIHRIKGEQDPAAEAVRYGAELPRLHLVMLGLGEDGHTASIFPGSIGILASGRLCEVSAHPQSGQKRITVTGKVLAQAARLVFMVTGTSKAQMVADILGRKAGYEAYPAGLVNAMRGDIEWWLDEDAASMLKEPA